MEENKIYCSRCGALIDDEDFDTVNGEPICQDCAERYTVTCEQCEALIWESDSYGDEYTNLCRHCYENYYTQCEGCNALVQNDDAYHLNGYTYCHECYDEERNKCRYICDYSYKPEPVFYGDPDRYFGIELEIDGAGKDDDYAEEILNIGNKNGEHIYIKSDGSLDDGMEIVTHPMTMDYHLNDMPWEDVMKKAISLGYRSHQTSTCGLHIHVNRESLGESVAGQELVISRILYFVEHHWNELLKFSRRSEYTMNRWASRYGYESTPQAIMEKAKKRCCGRYAAVNLCNYSTIEFRLFRGTLKHNTLIAALELVNKICDLAIFCTDDEMQKISWSEFVAGVAEAELIQYLKERNLYINEEITSEEEF